MIIDIDTSELTEEQIDEIDDLMIEFNMGNITDEDDLFEQICEVTND